MPFGSKSDKSKQIGLINSLDKFETLFYTHNYIMYDPNWRNNDSIDCRFVNKNGKAIECKFVIDDNDDDTNKHVQAWNSKYYRQFECFEEKYNYTNDKIDVTIVNTIRKLEFDFKSNVFVDVLLQFAKHNTIQQRKISQFDFKSMIININDLKENKENKENKERKDDNINIDCDSNIHFALVDVRPIQMLASKVTITAETDLEDSKKIAISHIPWCCGLVAVNTQSYESLCKLNNQLNDINDKIGQIEESNAMKQFESRLALLNTTNTTTDVTDSREKKENSEDELSKLNLEISDVINNYLVNSNYESFESIFKEWCGQIPILIEVGSELNMRDLIWAIDDTLNNDTFGFTNIFGEYCKFYRYFAHCDDKSEIAPFGTKTTADTQLLFKSMLNKAFKLNLFENTQNTENNDANDTNNEKKDDSECKNVETNETTKKTQEKQEKQDIKEKSDKNETDSDAKVEINIKIKGKAENNVTMDTKLEDQDRKKKVQKIKKNVNSKTNDDDIADIMQKALDEARIEIDNETKAIAKQDTMKTNSKQKKETKEKETEKEKKKSRFSMFGKKNSKNNKKNKK